MGLSGRSESIPKLWHECLIDNFIIFKRFMRLFDDFSDDYLHVFVRLEGESC